jgi:hypothetical protein
MTDIESGGFPTLAHVASRLDPDGESEAYIANVLSKKNPILDDIPFVEGNLATGHQITQATNALPSASWRRLNRGVAATLAETAQYTESCGILEDESKIDERLYELRGGAAFRESEDKLKMEGFAQQVSTALFYESTSSNPERVHGLAPRYPATTGYTSSSYTLAGTNAGTNARSIWLITWEERKAYGIFPKGTRAGLERQDKGLERVLDSSSNPFYAYVTRFVWRLGFAVEDYRYLVRFQWDPDDAAMASDDRGLYLKMLQMVDTIYDTTPNTMFYMDRTTRTRLNQQLASNDANYLTYVEKGGKRLSAFEGIPIRVVDALVAETAIS